MFRESLHDKAQKHAIKSAVSAFRRDYAQDQKYKVDHIIYSADDSLVFVVVIEFWNECHRDDFQIQLHKKIAYFKWSPLEGVSSTHKQHVKDFFQVKGRKITRSVNT